MIFISYLYILLVVLGCLLEVSNHKPSKYYSLYKWNK